MSQVETRAETLPDRWRFLLDAKTWVAFQVALQAQSAPALRLEELLTRPSVFERCPE